jgi:hypothetical protein
MSKEIVKKDAKQMALEVPPDMQELLAMMPKVEAKDLSIPTILTVQSTSEFIEGVVDAGHIINRDTLQVLGGNGKRINFVPLTFFKSWQHFSKTDGKQKWIKEELYTGQEYKWTEKTSDGVELVHDETYSFYILLESDLTNQMALPYLLKLKRTSAGEAKKLVTAIERAKTALIEPWSLLFSIDTTREKGDKGPYYVTVVNPVIEGTSVKRIKDEALTMSREWSRTVIKNQASLNARKVQEADVAPSQGTPKPPPQFDKEEQLPF